MEQTVTGRENVEAEMNRVEIDKNMFEVYCQISVTCSAVWITTHWMNGAGKRTGWPLNRFTARKSAR